MLQALRFGAVGLVNTLIGLSCIYGLMFFFHAGAGVANAAGYGLGFGVSFVLNRVWTFGSTRSVRQVLPRFLLAASGCYLLNFCLVMAGTGLGHFNPYLAQLIGVGAYTASLFLLCRWWVFR
jgi:putative flippase GtrA